MSEINNKYKENKKYLEEKFTHWDGFEINTYHDISNHEYIVITKEIQYCCQIIITYYSNSIFLKIYSLQPMGYGICCSQDKNLSNISKTEVKLFINNLFNFIKQFIEIFQW